VVGKTKAKQYYLGDKDQSRVLSVLLHGDAAFCGQGVVYEGFDLSQWKNFSTGGTVHIIVNNQIGFTTSLRDSRLPNSSPYPTDVAKTGAAPIFHVNGDDPEAVVRVMKLAAEYRQAFKKDVVVDVICYRRPGHNEIDEPRYTQPLMYKLIDKQMSSLDKYKQQLLDEKVLDQEAAQAITDKVMNELNRAHKLSASYVPSKMDWFSSYWKGYKSSAQLAKIHPTGVPRTVLSKVASALTNLPSNMKLHPGLVKIMKQKKQALDTGQGIDWATAEALAFGTLVLEGNMVRLTGQDVERGTFSHRHAVLHDNDTDSTYVPLNHIDPNQAPFFIHNSSLSEFAVLGYELGFSLENPNSLVLWEAQFGDFANGAQVIIDQFLSCGEQKWHRQSGLVLLLPHGYDGQGPEHSSARLERFLQLCDSDPSVVPENGGKNSAQYNMQVVNCTTPANYFHVLRRQVHRDFRKPLVVMSPKRLLRYPAATSSFDEFDDIGTLVRFRRVIPEPDPARDLVAAERVRRLVFCSGNVYYDLAQARRDRNIKDVALVRVEQLAPFPFDHIAQQGALYKNAEIAWAQEEPMNMGAWSFVYHHIKSALKPDRGLFEPRYFGRPTSASPATGSGKTHRKQLATLLDAALG
jgi:2-oxoglutarate dehydrogenase E1 component